MRDPERIMEMLSLLGKIWETVSDQRLGQLIVNLTRAEDGRIRDPWIVEDTELTRVMRKIVEDNNLGIW